jgi:hypothetical protein
LTARERAAEAVAATCRPAPPPASVRSYSTKRAPATSRHAD